MSKANIVAALLLAAAALHAQAPPGSVGPRPGRTLPEGPGKEVTQRVCGATCHSPEIIVSNGRTRNQWAAVVNSMVARGAKATDTELVQIVDYLSTQVGPNVNPAAPPPRAGMGGRPSGAPAQRAVGPGPLGSGAADSHVVDQAGVERGKTVYVAECITCHGTKARGGGEGLPPSQHGSDLVRSLVVLHDRYGSEVGPFLAKGHPLQSGKPGSSLSKEQIGDLAHFLHNRVYSTLRGSPEVDIGNILSGDPKAGAAFFNGPGKCSGCHSPTGDLAGIGKRYDPPTLQGKTMFPRTVGFGRGGAGVRPAKPVTVKVTQPNGQVAEGVLERLDDFNVSLRDAQGEYRSFKITPTLKVEKNDPYAAHIALLDQYTDKNMHDVVAYLETLK